jgi:hypothetical protein
VLFAGGSAISDGIIGSKNFSDSGSFARKPHGGLSGASLSDEGDAAAARRSVGGIWRATAIRDNEHGG